MRLAIILLLAALFIGALTSPTNNVKISADYLEPINYEDSNFQLGSVEHYLSTTDNGSGSTQIIRQVFAYSYGSHYYTLTASDYLGNQAAHSEIVFAQGDFTIDVISPSSGGTGTVPDVDVVIQTDPTALCSWSFYAPGINPWWVAMNNTNGNNFEITNFRTDHRFQENERVPIIIRCVLGNQESSIILPIGWATNSESLSATLFPNPIINLFDTTVSIQANTTEVSTCTLSSSALQQSIVSPNSYQHHFEGLPKGGTGTEYDIDCTNSFGSSMATYKLIVVEDGTKPIGINVNTPRLTNAQQTVLSVDTSDEAVCYYDISSSTPTIDQLITLGQQLGPLSNDRMHQTEITLSEGSNLVHVGCVELNNPINNPKANLVTTDIVRDTNAPTVTFVSSPLVCFDDTIITLSSTSNDITKIIIQSARGPVAQREWMPTSGSQMLIHQGGILPQAGDTLTIWALDDAGNPSSQITAPLGTTSDPNCLIQGIQQYINLLSPTNGGTDLDEWDLQIESEFDSSCGWTTASGSGVLNTPDGFLHSYTNFSQNLQRDTTTSLDIDCTSAAGDTTVKNFQLSWYSDAPTITAVANPTTVNNPVEPYTNITITSDQEVVCAVNGTNYNICPTCYSTTYRLDQVPISFGSGTNNISIECQNRVPAYATTGVVVTEDYPSTLIVTLQSPEVTNAARPLVEVSTSLLADCTAEINGNIDPLRRNGLIHTETFSLAEGTHPVVVACTEAGNVNKTGRYSYDLVVDRTAPDVSITTPATTCGLQQVVVKGTITDDTEIDRIDITFDGQNTTVTSLPEIINGLNLVENQRYTLEVTAYDTAGNSRVSTQQIQAKTEADGACDVEPPTVWLDKNVTALGVELRLFCRDDQGCKDQYKFGTGPATGSCALRPFLFSANKTTTITQTSKVCWEAEDLAGNKVVDEEVVNVVLAPSHCSNNVNDQDETGIDCGGSCPACTGTQACVDDSDCLSGICVDSACEGNSCSNGIMDGTESDVDCGGFTCTACATGDTCGTNFDCSSRSCISGSCQGVSCDDNSKNGDETGIDCGGSCPACNEGGQCISDSDCLTGICSYGTCTTERLQGPRTETPDIPQYVPDGPSIMGIIFIILGALLAMGGGGYIYWEKTHPPKVAPAMKTDPFAVSTSSKPKSPTTPLIKEDFAKSKLRESAKKKRASKRSGQRQNLMSAFSDDQKPKTESKPSTKPQSKPATKTPTKAPTKKVPKNMPSPPKSKSKRTNKDVFDQLDQIANRKSKKQLKDTAGKMIEKGTVKKHEVSSALSDLHSQGKLKKEEVEKIKNDLDL